MPASAFLAKSTRFWFQNPARFAVAVIVFVVAAVTATVASLATAQESAPQANVSSSLPPLQINESYAQNLSKAEKTLALVVRQQALNKLLQEQLTTAKMRNELLDLQEQIYQMALEQLSREESQLLNTGGTQSSSSFDEEVFGGPLPPVAEVRLQALWKGDAGYQAVVQIGSGNEERESVVHVGHLFATPMGQAQVVRIGSDAVDLRIDGSEAVFRLHFLW